MKSTFTNLYIGYNKEEDFRILICAFDETEAHQLAEEYRKDSKFKGTFEITEAEDFSNVHFDCDYVIK